MTDRFVSGQWTGQQSGSGRTYNNLTLFFSLRSFPLIFGPRVGRGTGVGTGITLLLS